MMMDPFGSLQNMLGQFRGFMQNPVGFMMGQKMNIPQNVMQSMMQDPNQAIQYLLNNGIISQDQYNWAYRQATQIQNMPQFQQFLNGINGKGQNGPNK